ncbi:MAG: glycosyltransferase [Candidatus Nealsonbacteria bacterium]
MISIIIPTYNEEKYLPALLESIENQEFKDLEIIVSDNKSTDKTVIIAEKYGCKITSGGLPAKGRNQGAKIAKGEIFLFLDADVVLPIEFIKKSILEFNRRNLDVASYKIVPKKGNKIAKGGLDILYNWPAFLSQGFLPYGAMGIIVKKKIFDKIGGFNEKIKIAEDHYFVRQVAEVGKFGIISSTKIFISLRRFKTDGYAKTLSKYLLASIYMLSGKPVKRGIKYDFGHYSNKKKN